MQKLKCDINYELKEFNRPINSSQFTDFFQSVNNSKDAHQVVIFKNLVHKLVTLVQINYQEN